MNILAVVLILLGTAVFGFILATVTRTLIRSGQRPIREWTPREGDMFYAEVYTQTAIGGGRTLSLTYHKTKEEAFATAKKNAQWFDDFGGVHPDVGIYWIVSPITAQEEKVIQ